jgi:N-acetylneuraminic acid mutarotase
MPTPRLDAVAVEHGGSIYVIGGIGKRGGGDAAPDIRAVEEYDPATDRWRKRQPAPLRPEAAVSVGERIFVLGRTAMFEFTPSRDEWRARAALPAERQAFGVAVVGQRVLVIGGSVPDKSRQWGWSNTASVEEYDPKKDAWRSRAPMMTPRHQAAVASIGSRVYVMGGAATFADDLDRDIDRVEIYDADADRWSVGPRMPGAMAYFAAFASGGRIVTLPGSNPRVALQEYDPGALRWRLLDDSAPPTSRWRCATAMAGGRVFVFGGAPRGPAAEALDTTEEWGPAPAGVGPR